MGWELSGNIRGPSGPLARASLQYVVTQADIDAGAGAYRDVALALPVGARVIRVATSAPAWVRLYAGPDDDDARLRTDAIGYVRHLAFDVVTDVGALEVWLSPTADAHLADPVAGEWTLRLAEPWDFTAGLTVTIDYVRTE